MEALTQCIVDLIDRDLKESGTKETGARKALMELRKAALEEGKN
jgi:hypothetical protein